MPHRRVVRVVQGVSLQLPWSHRLPDYAGAFDRYGQNLVALAEQLCPDSGPLRMVDVGANIGDSALQVLARMDARVLCVEGDPYWLAYLYENVSHDARVTVVPTLISEEGGDAGLRPERAGGTSRLVADARSTVSTMTAADLRTSSGFDHCRLIKSDTDGFDTRIIPALARAWSRDRPVLFLEFDPALARLAGDPYPELLWSRLHELGYESALVWNNFGDLLGARDVAELADEAAILDSPSEVLGYHYWDVAVCHRHDEQGIEALRLLATMNAASDRPGD